MSTLFELGVSKIDFFDASGTWTCPDDIDEIILVGSGGGGGGAGGGYVGNGAGNPGGAGGDTTMSAPSFDTQTFPGGAGGVGSGFYVSYGGQNGNGFGRGPSGHHPSSTGVQGEVPGGDWSTQMPIMGNLNCFFFPGGKGAGMRAYADLAGSQVLICEGSQPGSLTNGGTGWIGAYQTRHLAAVGYGSAGAGGAAMGVFRKVKVRPGAIYTLTIGSGGGGAPSMFSTGPSGGGGAGGFLAIGYNQQPKNAA